MQVQLRQGGCGAICRDLLAGLPEWFGIAESNAAYANDAETLPTWLALQDGTPVGLMILKRHGEGAIENWLLAVRKDLRGQGVGRALIEAAESFAAGEDVPYLTVKTLGPSEPYEPYEETRAFYRSVGFIPLEEFTQIWGPENPCLFMVKPVRRTAARPARRRRRP